MSCRCSEIQKCDQDICSLESELAREFEVLQQNSHLVTALSGLGQDLIAAVSVDNIDRIETRLKAIKKQRETVTGNLQTKRSNELTRVRSRRTTFESADRRYHEMLEQRARR